MASNAAKPLAWLHSISPWILKIPVTFIEVAVWVFMTYYVIGFDPNFGRFIRPYVVLVAISQMTSALFRFIAAMGRNIVCCELFWLICSASSFCIDWIHFITRFQQTQTRQSHLEFKCSRAFFTEPNWCWLGVGSNSRIHVPIQHRFRYQFEKPKALIPANSNEYRFHLLICSISPPFASPISKFTEAKKRLSFSVFSTISVVHALHRPPSTRIPVISPSLYMRIVELTDSFLTGEHVVLKFSHSLFSCFNYFYFLFQSSFYLGF